MRQGHPAFIWIVYGVFVLLNIIDLVYTENALQSGLQEGNPLMERIYLDYGIQGISVVKGIVLTVIFLLVPTINYFRSVRRIFYFVVFVYTCVTFYHIWLYLFIL